jgi:hypothetical protein
VLSASSIQASQPYFTSEVTPIKGGITASNPQDLCLVANGTLDYLNKGKSYDPKVIHAGITASFNGDIARVKATLAFICKIEQEDTLAGRSSRLQDMDFINRQFDVIRWRPNKQQSVEFEINKPLLKNIPDDQLLLTKYYIKKAKGSAVQTPAAPYALYQVPFDEQSLTLEQADAKRELITRYRYTKQQVLTGVLDTLKLAKPMIWLSRDALEDTLMQGTVMIEGDKGSASTFYNVDRNNGIGYDRALKKQQQKRYWYFKKNYCVLGYGKDASYKIPIKPLVTVAGDLSYLGLGKLIMLSHNGEHRLTVLADTGGAFANNQYQLDYLGGYFYNWSDYIKSYRHFPDYVETRILLLK